MNDSNSANSGPKKFGDTRMSASVNNDEDSLSNHLNRMSLATAASTALPPSSPANPVDSNQQNVSPALPSRPVKTPIRRAPSSSSLGGSDKPSSPTLQKRTSTSSLRDGEGKMPPRSPASRRSSSYFHNLSMGDRSSLPPPVEEAPKPPVTAASIAHECFKKELEAKHESSEVNKPAQTVVILQDACYGHRYCRPKTSKGTLSTIVERPERVHASLLGVATAYVRLGGRHAEGAAAPHPKQDPSSIPPAPFTIHKTPRTLSLRSAAAVAIHGREWMEELTIMCEKAESKLAINGKELTREIVNGQSSSDALVEKPRLHEGDLYLCSESLGALEGALGGVCEGVDEVFSEKGPKRAFVCIRPPGHHCAADMPSGFCWINNVHVGIGHAATTHGLTHAAIIDFDLHHGDGSQSIAWDHNARVASMPKNAPMTKKVPIGYFSLHDINSYPCEMGDEEKVRNASLCIENAHGQSIWNVHLQPWKTESEFWALYEDRYLVLLAKARAFLKAHNEKLRQNPTHPKPKAAIFLSAGFDASEWESPGMQRHKVHVPTEFYARFTCDVVKMAEEETSGVDGRVISVLEGGYSDRALMSGTLSHISGLATKTSISRPSTSGSSAIGQDIQNGLSSFDVNGDSPRPSKPSIKQETQNYDPLWWSVSNLEELETLIDPNAHVAPAPKGPRGKVQPTFTMPTESFISKVVEAPQGRRSTSGAGRPPPSVIPRGPSPPPPEVGWATASLELRNLLVPTDRETTSCKPEDLNAEATRKRRDRQSNIAALGLSTAEQAPEGRSMQLREKRGKAPEIVEEDQKPVSRASRRKTIADPNLLAKEETPPPAATLPTRPVRRRSSAASSLMSIGTMNTDRASELSLPAAVDQRAQLGVKKARAPVVPRGEDVKPNAAVKRPAVARKPSSNPAIPTGNSKQVDVSRKDVSNDGGKSKEMDQLSSGMKGMSIKLNVPPKEEYEAREPKAKPAPRGRPPKSTAAKTVKAKSPTKANKAKAPVAASGPVVTAPKLPDPPVGQIHQKQQAGETQPPLSSNPFPSSSEIYQKPALPHQLPSTIPSQANSNTAQPFTRPIQQPPPTATTSEPTIPAPKTPTPQPPTLPSNPPNMPLSSPNVQPPPFSPITPAQHPSTPTTAKRNTKENLPVFTATSPISFGKPRQPGTIDQTLLTQNTTNESVGPMPPPPPSYPYESSVLPSSNWRDISGGGGGGGDRPNHHIPSGLTDLQAPLLQSAVSAEESQTNNNNNNNNNMSADVERKAAATAGDDSGVASIWDIPAAPQPPQPQLHRRNGRS